MIKMVTLIIGVFALITALLFLPAWALMTVWNFLAVQAGWPVINIWIAWLVCYIIWFLSPKSSNK